MENTGIYIIKNEINGKVYVGSAIDFNKRWNRHTSALNKGKHHSKHLQSAWNKYGESAFFFEKIQYCTKEDLIKNEQWWLDLLNPEYNMVKFAGCKLRYMTVEERKEGKRLANKKYRENNKEKCKLISEIARKRLYNLNPELAKEKHRNYAKEYRKNPEVRTRVNKIKLINYHKNKNDN